MRFMVIVRSTDQMEAGELPTEEQLTAMGRYNEELVKAGVLLAAEGLHPSSRGARVRTSKGRTTVLDGPFTETKELIAGFWLIEVKSRAEAIEWVRRVPVMDGEEAEYEVRQVFEDEDFGPAMTEELREDENRRRAEIGHPRT